MYITFFCWCLIFLYKLKSKGIPIICNWPSLLCPVFTITCPAPKPKARHLLKAHSLFHYWYLIISIWERSRYFITSKTYFVLELYRPQHPLPRISRPAWMHMHCTFPVRDRHARTHVHAAHVRPLLPAVARQQGPKVCIFLFFWYFNTLEKHPHWQILLYRKYCNRNVTANWFSSPASKFNKIYRLESIHEATL